MIVRYAPGTGMAIVSPTGVVVLAQPPAGDAADRVLAAVTAGGGVGEVLDALTQAFGSSLAAVPEFGMVVDRGSHYSVVLRGAMRADISSDGDTTSLSGAGAATWREADAPAGSSVAISVGDADGAAAYSVRDGIVPCASVTVAPEAAANAAPAAPAAAPEAPAAPATTPGAEADATAAQIEHTGETTLLPDREPAAPAADDDDFAIWGATVLEAPQAAPVQAPEAQQAPPPQQSVAPSPAPEPQAAPQQDAQPAPPAVAAPEPTPAPAPAPAPAPEPEPPRMPLSTPMTADGMISGVPDFGAMRSSAPAQEPAPAAPPSPPPAPPVAPTAAPPPAAALAAPTPAPATPPQPAAAAPSTGGFDHPGDHDGETRVVAKTQGTVPEATSAGAPPPAGTLSLSTGERVSLASGVVIGRRPKATRVTGELPVLVAVPSPNQDVSRSHLEVRIEGTTAVAVDLNTTNGTVLKRAGSDPVRLHPNEPTVLVNGDILDVGDGVEATYLEAQ